MSNGLLGALNHANNDIYEMTTKSMYERAWEHETLPVFRAREPLQCAFCMRTIAPEEVFTRTGSLKKRVAGLRYVLCTVCEPVSKAVHFP